jgi:tetratricopeptide (TPR) repeat protein
MNSWQIKIIFSILLAGGINLVALQPNLLPPLLAQSKIPDPKVNPLEKKIDARDPIIPSGYGKRELSTFEIARIEREIKRLEETAARELEQGNEDQAFELWYRRLKLARAINTEVEIEALGKIGAIAWRSNRAWDLRNIANRLIVIELEISDADSASKLLQPLATAYEQVRYLEQAIAVYQQILRENKQQQNSVAEAENLTTLGKLYIAQFNYPSAAKTYQELLTLAEAKSDSDQFDLNQVNFYLSTLSDLYDRTGQTQRAIATRKRLIDNYTASNQLKRVAALEFAIAQDHATLNQTQQAKEAYQRAVTLATAQQQLAIALDALDSLGKLYLKKGQEQEAIATYMQLLEIQQQSDDDYGLINTYDTLGKIYLVSGQNKLAKHYFQQALDLSQTLNYQVEYFKQQISRL